MWANKNKVKFFLYCGSVVCGFPNSVMRLAITNQVVLDVGTKALALLCLF